MSTHSLLRRRPEGLWVPGPGCARVLSAVRIVWCACAAFGCAGAGQRGMVCRSCELANRFVFERCPRWPSRRGVRSVDRVARLVAGG